MVDFKSFNQNMSLVEKSLLSKHKIGFKYFLTSKKINSCRRVFKCENEFTENLVNSYHQILKHIFYDKSLNEECSKNIQVLADSYNNGNYNYIRKFDLATFFDSINTDILLQLICEGVSRTQRVDDQYKDKLIDVITETHNVIIEATNKIDKKLISEICDYPGCNCESIVDVPNKCKKLLTNGLSCFLGVPQGLTFANIYANIYMEEIDNLMKKKKGNNCTYLRYVDDIIIVSHSRYGAGEFKAMLDKYSLKLNDKKTEIFKRNGQWTSFNYLGHELCNNANGDLKIRVARSNIKKRYNKFYAMYCYYNKKFDSGFYTTDEILDFIRFDLNISITGFHKQETERQLGWLDFFQNITEINDLFIIDKYIKRLTIKLFKNNKVPIKGEDFYDEFIKKHVKAYHCIRGIKDKRNRRYLLKGTYYSEKFGSEISISTMKSILKVSTNKDYSNKNDKHVNEAFNKYYYNKLKSERRESVISQ